MEILLMVIVWFVMIGAAAVLVWAVVDHVKYRRSMETQTRDEED